MSSFFDCVDAETFGLTWEEIGEHIKNQNSAGIKLVPSWMFELVPDNSIDLVTATFMLNEMPLAGILWLISNCTRVMKKGSYLLNLSRGFNKLYTEGGLLYAPPFR